jgi:hypothetical protein
VKTAHGVVYAAPRFTRVACHAWDVAGREPATRNGRQEVVGGKGRTPRGAFRVACVGMEEKMWEKGITKMRVFCARGEGDMQTHVVHVEGPAGRSINETVLHTVARTRHLREGADSLEHGTPLMTIPNSPFVNCLRKDPEPYCRQHYSWACRMCSPGWRPSATFQLA